MTNRGQLAQSEYKGARGALWSVFLATHATVEVSRFVSEPPPLMNYPILHTQKRILIKLNLPTDVQADGLLTQVCQRQILQNIHVIPIILG